MPNTNLFALCKEITARGEKALSDGIAQRPAIIVTLKAFLRKTGGGVFYREQLGLYSKERTGTMPHYQQPANVLVMTKGWFKDGTI